MISLLLLQKYRNTNAVIHFWRTTSQAEVDFVINTGMELIPVEVKYNNIDKPVIGRSLFSFSEKYKPKFAYIVNLTYDFERTENNCHFRFIPFWKLIDEEYV